MKENIKIIIKNKKIDIVNLLLGGSNSFNDLEVSQDEIINSLDLLNYFDSNLTSYTATSNFTDLVNVSINNTNLDITLVQNGYSILTNSLNQDEILSFTIPDNYSSDLKYFCYSHSSMISNFTIEDTPVDMSSINTKFYVRLNSNPFNSPYFIFSLTENGTSLNESSNLVLYRGITYEFEKTDSGHPFNIGSNHNENATGIVVTSNGTGGTVYSEALITVSATDGSTTSSQSFKIKVNQDNEPTGTITFTDNVIINQTITASVNLSDNDGPLTLGYQWQVSDDNSTFTNISGLENQGLSFVIPSDYVGKYIRLQVNSVDNDDMISQTIVNGDFETNVTLANGQTSYATPDGWTENGYESGNTIIIHGEEDEWLGSNNTDDNTMIGFRWSRKLYQEITGYTGFYTLTFDLIKRTLSGNTDIPNINVLINNEVKLDEQVSNETIEQRTITWFNTEDTIRIEFASTDPITEDKTFFIDNVAVYYTSSGFSTINSYSREVKDVFGDIQVNTSSSNTIIKLENTYLSLYNSYYAKHHRSDGFENLIFSLDDYDGETFFNDIKYLKNHYITIPDFSGDTFYTFDASVYSYNTNYNQLKLRDPYGNRPEPAQNTYYTFNVYSFIDNSSLEYSNVTSSDSNIVPTITSTWEQIGNTIYGTNQNDNIGNNISLSSDGLVVAFKKGSTVEVYEKINENWTQKGSTIDLVNSISYIQISVDGTKLFAHIYDYDTNYNNKAVLYKYNNASWEKLVAEYEWSSTYLMSCTVSKDCKLFAIGFRVEKYIEVWKLDDDENGFTQYGNTITEDIYRFGAAIKLSEDGEMICIQNPYGQFVTEVDTNLIGEGYMDVYYYDDSDTNNPIWSKKGSRVYQEKSMNTVHAFNFDFNTTGNTFSFGNWDDDNYILKTVPANTDASTIISEYENIGYSLYTAYHGTSLSTLNLLNSTIYDSLNDGKLLNINDYNKIRYDIYNFNSYDDPEGSYIKTSYSNDIFKNDDYDNDHTDNEIYNLIGNTDSAYLKISGFFSPINSGYYRLLSRATEDGFRIRFREFNGYDYQSSTDTSNFLEDDSNAFLSLVRLKNSTIDWPTNSGFTGFFKYIVFNFTGDYNSPVGTYRKIDESSTFLEWDDDDDTTDWYTLAVDTTEYIFLKIQFIFSVDETSLYNFTFFSDDGIRIKIVELNDTAPDSNTSTDWDDLTNLDNDVSNWSVHGAYNYNYQINLQKHRIYKAYIEYCQGWGGYTLSHRVNKNTTTSDYSPGTDYSLQEHPNFSIFDTRPIFDSTNYIYTQRETFSSGGTYTDVSLDNIYFDSSKNYEFLIEYTQDGGTNADFILCAERTDTDEFTSIINDINTEFVNLINIKSRFEIFKERLINVFRYDVYNSPSLDDLTYVKTHYKNELLSWAGTANVDTTNLSLLTGDLGDEYVLIIITIYFTPVETNNYIFKFNENDDQVFLNIVEYGNDINSGSIDLSLPYSNATSNAILLESTKTYQMQIQWRNGPGYYKFEPQVEIGNSGTFVDLYDKNNFTFKSSYEVTGEDISFTSQHLNWNLYDPNYGIPKWTYYVFKSEKAGSTYIYQYDDTLNDWYQLGNTIYNSPSSLEPQNDNSGNVVKINETGKVIAITESGYENGNVKVMQYNPYGISISNIYGSGIDSPNVILTNNQRLYQGSYIISPNENYILMFQESNGNLVLRYNSDPENTSIETDYDNFDVLYHFSIQNLIGDNITSAYAVMEYGNLNVYDLDDIHRYSYTTNAKSGVLSLDNNGNLSIVENWIQKGNNIIGYRGKYIDDDNGQAIDISKEGLTLAIGSSGYDDTNINYDIGLLRIYDYNNELTLANVNSLDIDSSVNISMNVTDGNVNEVKTFTVSNVDDTVIGNLRIISNTANNLYEGGTLTADISSLTDPDGTITISSYEWEISNSSNFEIYSTITNATDSSFTIPKDTESSSSYVGQYIRLKVIANDTEFFSEPRLVLNIEDEATGYVFFTSNMDLILEESLLTAMTNLSDLDNNKLIFDTNDVGSLSFDYQWQISSDDITFTNIENANSSTYKIPLNTYTGQYIRLLITTTDRRGGNTDFLSTSHLIEQLNLVTQTNISDSNNIEGNNYVFDLSSIIFNNFDVSFNIKTDAPISQGSSVIDTNKLLTFTPNNAGVSTIVVTASIDSSITSFTQDITFTIEIQSFNYEPTGTITFTDNVIINQTISATVNLSDNDGSLTLGYQWQVSDDNSTFTNISGLENQGLSFVIPSDYVEKYIRLQVNSVDIEGGLSTINSYSRQVKDVFGDIQVNTSSSDTVIKLENIHTSYNSYYAMHHRSDGTYHETLMSYSGEGQDLYNYTRYLNNHYITIPDFSGDTFYTFDVFIYGDGTYYGLTLRDPDGNRPELSYNTYYTFNVYSFIGNSSLHYSDFISSDSNIVPTLSSTWDQVGSSIYGEGYADKSGSGISLSTDGTIISIGEYNEYSHESSDNIGSVRVFEYINDEWTQKGSKLSAEQEIDWFGFMTKLSGDGTKLFVSAPKYDVNTLSDAGKLYIYTFTNNDWLNVNTIEGDTDQHSMVFDASEDGTVFAFRSRYQNKVTVYNYDYSTNVYSVKGSVLTGSSNFGENISLSGDGNNILITNDAGNYYIYTYDTDDWIQKGSIVYSDQNRPNSSLKLNYNGTAFIYGGVSYNNLFVRTVSVGEDVSSVLTNLENEGYSLYTAYFGTNNETNLSDGSKYESLNDEKILNIYDYNKVRYDVYTFSGDYDNPDDVYQTTSYSEDIYNFSLTADSTDTTNELYQIAGFNTVVYVKTFGFFTPIDTGYYRLAFHYTDDGVRIRLREFTTSTDIENDSTSMIPLIRKREFTNYFKYAVYNFDGNYDTPFDSSIVINTHQSNTLLEWNSYAGFGTVSTSNYATLINNNDNNNVFIKMEVVFSTSEDDEYYFEFDTDDGIRIKIVEFNDIAPNSNTGSDWEVLTNIEDGNNTNWEGHGAVQFRYTISLQKHRIYKAYIEYTQGTGYYTFFYNINRSGDSTFKKFEEMFQLHDTEAAFDTTNHIWEDKDSFSGGGGNTYDVTLDNIYLENTKNYEFLIEFADGGGAANFNLYAEKTDTDSFTSSFDSFNLEFASLINLKSKFEVLKETLINTKFVYNVYDGVDLNNLVNGITYYKNELLNWTGTANVDTTNLTLLTGDLGDENITIEILGYFSPVETNDYIFRFLDNDDAISFSLIENGDDFNNSFITLSNNTSNSILLESTKIYNFRIQWRQASGYYKFEPQVEIGNSGTFVDFYNTSNFDFKVYNDYNPLNLITSTSASLGLYDPNYNIDKFTYLVFYFESAYGKSKVYEYKTDINGTTDWYQLGNDILGLSSGGFGGFRSTLDESGRQIATNDVRHDEGTVRLLKHNPIGTSIYNFYGSGIDSSNIILANNEKIYQGTELFSPNENYKLSFQSSDGNLVLYEIGGSALYSFNTRSIGDNQTTAYAVMEDGNLNIYEANGDHRYSFTSGSTSGVLSLDNNGNFSIVDNWIEIKRFSGGGEQGYSIDFSPDGTRIAIGTKNFDNTLTDQGRTEIYQLNNELTLANVNSISIDSSTDISFNVTDGTNTEYKTFTVSNINDTTFGELRILANTINIYEGGTLTADISSLTDPDGTISVTYQWEISSDSINYTSISDATNSTFTIPKDSESSFSYAEQYIRLKIIANDDIIYSDPKFILNIDDDATGTISFSSNLDLIQEGAILNAVINLTDVDNNKLVSNDNESSLSFAYQWQISQNNTYFTNIDNATSDQFIIPLVTYTGKYIRLFITTTDRRGGTNDFVTTSNLIEVNNSPFFNTTPVTTAYEGQEYEYSFTFTDADENQIISISNITYPSWISFDTSSNKLTGTPTSNDIDDNSVSITITDGTNETTQDYTININRIPILENELNLTFNEDEIIDPINLDLYFSDYDDDTINYTINSYDTNFLTASIDSDRKLNLILANNQFGVSNITITATDGYGSITRTGTITINPINDDPTGTISIVGITLPNNELSVDLTQITDIDDTSFIYKFIWQMSSNSNTWDTSNDISTSSTFIIPDTNDNENYYIRVKVFVEDGDTNDTEFISNEVQIQKLNLITSFSQNGTIDEDNNYTFDLSSIIDSNYDVSFAVNTDDTNGTSLIDSNKLLTFTPNLNYNGSSSFIIIASTDTSITSITQDITFDITINPVNDQPTGSVSIIGIVLPNNELSVDLTQITDIDDSNLFYTYLWQLSADSNTWDSSTNVGSSSTFIIPDTNDNENYYIRVKVFVEDNDTNNTEFISNEVQIQKLNLITSFTQNDTIDEDNNYTFDLTSIIDSNYDVSFEIKTDDSNGSSIIDSNKLLTFTPDSNFNESSSIIIKAFTDSAVTSITQDITFNIEINPVNDTPIFNDGSFSTNEDTQTTFDLLSLASDIENDSLTFSISSEPSKGSASILGSILTYTPSENLNGLDSIEIRVSDGELSSTGIISITINPVNDQPTGSVSIIGIVLPNNELSVNLTQITDIDDSNLFYTYLWQLSADSNTWDSSTNVGSSSTFIIPDTNDNENYYIRVKVFVQDNDTNNTEFISNEVQIQKLDLVNTFTINDTIDEDNNYTFDLTSIIDSNYDVSFNIKTDDLNGSSIIDSNKLLTFTPDSNYNGSSSIIISASTDSSVTSITQDITFNIEINPVNDTPIFNDGSFSTNEDTQTTFDLLSLASDIENDSLTFSISSEPSKGSASILDSILTYTPSENLNGLDSIEIRVSDGELSSTGIISITINPVNDQPTGSVSIVGTVLPNNELSIDLTQITDIDDSNLYYTYLWQLSADSNTWDSSTNVGSSSTFIIPDTNDNENYYIRVKVFVEDNDTNNTEFISNEVQIQKLDLVNTFTIDYTIDEDNNYTFDLTSIIDSNYDVSFKIKTDDLNGSSIIDSNKLLTFTPDSNYNGSSSIIITASTDSSVTSITQDITFNIEINPVNDDPTGIVLIEGIPFLSNTLSSNLNISDIENDVLEYSYNWETSIYENSWENSIVVGTNSSFVIDDTNYMGQYIRLVVSIKDSDTNDNIIISSNTLKMSDINLVTNDVLNESVLEDNIFTYDLNNVKDTNYNVYFSINSVLNGQVSISDNDILTFIPDLNYFGDTTILLDVRTDSSITSIVKSLLFNLSVISVNDEPTGTISIIGDPLPNVELSVDFSQINDVDDTNFSYTYVWQLSSDNNMWDSSNDIGTSSTFRIPDTNDNENKYIRVKVNIEDSDTNNTEFISNIIKIERIDLINLLSETDLIIRNRIYTFDLSSIIDSNYDVLFEIKTDDINGNSVIDTNKLLTFTPNFNFVGLSTIILTAFTDSSVTSITQDISFSITVYSELNIRNTIDDISMLTFDNFEYQLPEFKNVNSVDNKLTFKNLKNRLSVNWIFYDDRFETESGDTVLYELFIDNNPVNNYDWIEFINGKIKISPQYQNIGSYTFKIKTTDLYDFDEQLEFNVEVSTNIIRFEKQFYNNNKEVLVELDATDNIDALNKAFSYLETNNLSQETHNVITFHTEDNKVKIHQGNNNNHTMSDNDFIDTFIISKYLDNVRRTKQSIVLRPNKNLNIEFL